MKNVMKTTYGTTYGKKLLMERSIGMKRINEM